jgi:8-oxo-dGTP diphosphatase
MIEAAGGVIWRTDGKRRLEVLLIHRPRYDDWSFPKGKLDPGESHVDCAEREVLEETGLTCTLGPELPAARYVDRKGRPKRVRYWAMHGPSGTFHPNAEVDEIEWLRLDDAARRLSYVHDVAVLHGLDAVDVAAAS